MSKIAVVGPGAIGGAMTAWLAQDKRHEVTVAARTAFESVTLETPDSGVLVAAPRVITSPELATPVDWVLVATKAYDSVGASRWLPGFMGANTYVAILQNGVEHVERFAPYLPVDRIVPVMVDYPAERSAPGKIRQRGRARMVVATGVPGAAFVSLFSSTPLDVMQEPDFRTVVWKKLCFNSAGALSAVMLKPAVISRHEGVADIMRAIVRECVAVGLAEGARLDGAIVEAVITGYRASPPDAVNSLHADRVAGRPMETDARNGVIVRLGRKHGIPTPINEMVVAMLEAAA